MPIASVSCKNILDMTEGLTYLLCELIRDENLLIFLPFLNHIPVHALPVTYIIHNRLSFTGSRGGAVGQSQFQQTLVRVFVKIGAKLS